MDTLEWYLLSLVATATVVYLFWGWIRNAFVLWTIAFGGADGRREMDAKSRLHAYVARSELLDEVSLTELYYLCREIVDSNKEVGLSALQDVVLSYKYVSFYRERVDGSLRGMLLLDEKERTHLGRDIMVFRLGLALFKQQYRGGSLPYIFFLYRVLRCFLLKRKLEVYVLTKLFSYKSYMIAMNFTNESYPRYDKETPEFEKSLIDEFGHSLETATAKYDPKTCVVTRSHVRLERHAAPIREKDLQNPHIGYFSKVNPEWQKGHCLVTCSKVTPMAVLRLASNSILRSLFCRSRHTPASPKKPKTLSEMQGQSSLMIDSTPVQRCYTSSVGDLSSFIVTVSEDTADLDVVDALLSDNGVFESSSGTSADETPLES